MLLLLELREEYKARGSDATAATPVRPFAGYDEFFGNTPESHKTASLAALLGNYFKYKKDSGRRPQHLNS